MFAVIVSFLITWGTVCAAVVAPVTQVVQTSYRWEKGYLYYGTYLVGCYNGQKYYGWDGVKWVDAPCPTQLPKPTETKAPENFGVDMSKINGQCSVNGQPCSKQQAFAALEKGKALADDTAKLRLTIYGDGREGVVQDIEKSPLLAEYRDKFLIQSYPKDHWAVDPKLNFPAPKDGKPVVLVTFGNGKVVHAQKDYDDGSAGLAKALAESLRRPVPHTDPDKFPDLRKGVNLPDLLVWLKSRSPLGVQWWVVLLTVGVLYYINRKKPPVVPAVVVNTTEKK